MENTRGTGQRPRAVSRRAVLAAAGAGGAGVAAARVLGLRRVEYVDANSTAEAVAGRSGLDWVSPLDTEHARIAHLLRRTTFGATAAELDAAGADGYARTVDRLVETRPADPPVLAGADAASAEKSQRIDALQTWWIDHMIASPTPFAEVMTLFWHGHFTTEFRKVGLQSPYMYWQNRTWRRFALRDLRSMLYDVTVDPAMLRYLDLSSSTGRNPNENYARELMELYTMGVEAYTEEDVRSAAKALAGWREPRTQQMVDAQIARQLKETGKAPATPPKADTSTTGIFEPRRAYTGALQFLNTTRQWDAQLIIDKILEHANTAPFVARKIVARFVQPSPDAAYVTRLADRFRSSKYDMKVLMRDVLMSPEFTAPAAYRALVKSPVELMVHAAKALANPALSKLIVSSSQAMGQVLFDPPSVGGWPDNASWVSSNTMLARVNFAVDAVTQTRKLPKADDAHARHLDSVLSPATLRLLNEAATDKARWQVVLASPEFQLK